MRLALMLAALAAAALVGCNKKVAKNATPDAAPPPYVPPANAGTNPDNNPGILPAGGVGVVTNPGAVAGGGGGGGAVGAVRKAVRRTQALNELKTLGEFIEEMRDPVGKMPTKEQILASVQKSSPAIYKAIEEGSYVVTGTTDGGGLWAYEVDADKTPGIAVIGGRATRSTPDELRPYFANMPKAPAPPPPAPKSGALNTTPAGPPAQPAAPALAVGQKDMEDVRIYIDNASGASGRMPGPKEVYDALVLAKSPAAGLVEKKAIVLTGATTRDSVWAFETTALTRGGLVASQNGVETVTAVELNRRLKASR